MSSRRQKFSVAVKASIAGAVIAGVSAIIVALIEHPPFGKGAEDSKNGIASKVETIDSKVAIADGADGTAVQSGNNSTVTINKFEGSNNTQINSQTFNIQNQITAQNVIFTDDPNTLKKNIVGVYEFTNRLDGGQYYTKIRYVVPTPYPVANLYVEVHATNSQDIRDVYSAPLRGGAEIEGMSGPGPGFYFNNIQNVQGVNFLTIISSSPGNYKVLFKAE